MCAHKVHAYVHSLKPKTVVEIANYYLFQSKLERWMQTEQSYSKRQKLAAQTLEGTKTQCWARLSSGRREIKSKPWLSIPQPTHTRTRANIISNCFFIWSFHLFFFFFSDRSQWTQPLDNSSWNNPYKWMSLVFSPVAHCSVEPYAISVDFGREGWGGGERERGGAGLRGGATLTNIGCLF